MDSYTRPRSGSSCRDRSQMRRMRAQADLEGKSLYAVCSRGSLRPDLFLTGLSGKLLTG
jgi:hypothetical protein